MPRSIQTVRCCLAFLLFLVSAAAAKAGNDIDIDLGRGPVTVHVPSSYDGSPTGVVMLLHGYSSTGPETELILQLQPQAEQLGFFYLYPTGTLDFFGENFWNATDACCDFLGTGVDDSTYLRDLLDEVATQLVVDPSQIFIVGHSNGGFMAHRMACDHAGFVQGIVSLAGATWDNPADCQPEALVHVLQIHGSADGTIDYNGGQILGQAPYPSAVQSVETWATKNGCTLAPDTSLPDIDLEGNLPGAETSIARYADGCPEAGWSELWTVDGGEHVPVLSDDFHTLVLDFLFGDDGPTVFADGFESGNLSAWSLAVP